MSCVEHPHSTWRASLWPALILSAALALAAASCAPVPSTTGDDDVADDADDKGQQPEADAIGAAPGEAGIAASALTANVECDRSKPGRAVARLNWSRSSAGGSAQRIAVTIYGDRFEPGYFELSPELPPDATSFVWDRMQGQAFHFWRVVTLQSGKWVPSETAKFEGPTCVGGTKLIDPMNQQGGAP